MSWLTRGLGRISAFSTSYINEVVSDPTILEHPKWLIQFSYIVPACPGTARNNLCIQHTSTDSIA